MVASPAAAGASPERVEAVAARCRARLDAVETAWTGEPDGGVTLVADRVAAAERDGSPLEAVVAVGGDGTVREVAEGLARASGRWPSGSGGEAKPRGGGGAARLADGGGGRWPSGGGPALLVVPAGSGNSAYRALWGESPWTAAVDAALGREGGGEGEGDGESEGDGGRARPRRLDLLRLVEADRATLLGVNAGLVARIAQLVQEQAGVPEEDRYWAAIATALEDLRTFPGRVELDGRVVHEGPVTLATAGGVRRFGRGSFELLPRSVLDDGLLDVCVVGELTPERVEELARLVPGGEHLGRPGVSYGQGRRLRLERTDGEPLVVEHDGDPRPAGDVVTVEVVPGAVPVLAAPDAPPG
ncbi:MAG TPA: diacylglycerol kinase family protein [Thermoleophilaceae bacterium]